MLTGRASTSTFSFPENRELLYTWDRDLGCELARAYNDAVAQDLKECAHPEKYIGVGVGFSSRCRRVLPGDRKSGQDARTQGGQIHGRV